MYEPRGHFVPRPTEPVGHFVPTGDPTVRALASAATQHAESYVQRVLRPIMDDLQHRISHDRNEMGEHYVTPLPSVKARVEELERLIDSLPASINETIATSSSLGEVSDRANELQDSALHRKINSMQRDMPWMAPILVRLRHATSRQAIEQNVIDPAGDQLGL